MPRFGHEEIASPLMKPAFSVLKFSLCRTADGQPTQEVTRCGEFHCIELAFNAARFAALRDWHAALEEDRGGGREIPSVREILIKDTEWGYELKRDHLTVSRFWVHDTRPTELAGI